MKRWQKVCLMILGLALLGGFLIGNYFVDYALVPNQGGQDRDVSVEAVNQPGSTAATIASNKEAENAQTEAWLQEIEALIQPVQVAGHGGDLIRGHYYLQAQPESKWALVVHGYQSSEKEGQRVGQAFYQAGYNVLTYSQRAHGPSEGDFISMGVHEAYDLYAWVNQLVQTYPEAEIVFHGTSMGGATVLMASNLDLPANVKAVIADCAYTDIWSIFASELDLRFGLPAVPILNFAEAVAWLRAGFHFHGESALDSVQDSLVPTLFIHGDQDHFVPLSMSQALYEAKAGMAKDLVIVPGAGHGEARQLDPDGYYQAIHQFLDQHTDLD